MDVVGVILAGGQARRMGGGDKCLLDLDGQTLLARVIERLRPQVAELALNANGDPARFAGFGLPVLGDSIGGFVGPLAGVLAAMDWAADRGAGHVVTAAADTPFFPRDLVAGLISAAAGPGQMALAATLDPERGVMRHPTFGLWSVALRDDLRAALQAGTRKVVVWTDLHGTGVKVFDFNGADPFFNINRAEDMDAARENLQETLRGNS